MNPHIEEDEGRSQGKKAKGDANCNGRNVKDGASWRERKR